MTMLGEPRDAGLPTSIGEKSALVAEVLRAYRRARRLLKEEELAAAVEQLTADRPDRAPDSRDRVIALRLERAVTRILRLLPTDSRCLTRALVLVALLARRGIESSLVIGVRSGPDFRAHAWVEHRGAPLGPSSDYQVLARLPGRNVPVG
jgi:transglutaminase-like putative cysteine protease